ncbi:MAG: histidine kinase N-terminal 7TM domain-containing protein, partial [Chloroflexota bacterium]
MFTALLALSNEILTAAIVIIAVSMLLYNLWRNLRDRVARTSGAVLACVTFAYTADVLLSLNPDVQNYELGLRLQWIGLAFIPATLFHLSDALLATTGLPSRGRRRLGVRILYGLSVVFMLLAAFSDVLTRIVPVETSGAPVAATQEPGWLFFVYIFYYVSATGLAYINVRRAKQRCLTRDTRRRMGYLQFALLTPAIGMFPYSVLLGAGDEFSITTLILVNIANAIVILMLIFLSYPLSFFGSRVPDRVVKSELLSFFLRGPGTGLLVLGTILLTSQTTRILGVAGADFTPFAVVVVVLTWQWVVAIALPTVETALIYGNDENNQLAALRDLSDRLLSRDDLLQLMDAVLRAICDFVQVDTAFVVDYRGDAAEVVERVGPMVPDEDTLNTSRDRLFDMLLPLPLIDNVPVAMWNDYWVAPLYSLRLTEDNGAPTMVGIVGLKARADTVDLTPDEHRRVTVLVRRVERTLDDLALQGEIYAALEGLLPQISMTRTRAAEVEFLPPRSVEPQKPPTLPDHEQLVEQVRAALRHYWGGQGLTRSRLLELKIVRDELAENDNPA